MHRPSGQNAAMGTRQLKARAVLAANLKHLMDHLGVNQSAIGDKCGIHQTTVGRILKQKNAPDA
jgi:DNA-binding transcriptional regulator LsrR (DeoR family)